MTTPRGCCAPAAPLTPRSLTNRAGLTAIVYRVGTYATFRETMLEQIAQAPELAALTTREDDDYAVTIVDLWATVADVLTFYQERYANEAFLRTATRRQSIGMLARLIDYGLRPGVAALAWLAFTVEDGKAFQVPTRLRVQSVAGQNETPQTFETIESILADARLNRLRVLPAPYGANPLAPGSTIALVHPGLAGLTASSALAAGDRLVVYAVGAAGSIEELTLAERRIDEDRITLAWTSPVSGSWPADAPLGRVGRTFRLFGHTAPASTMQPAIDASVPGGIGWSLIPTKFDVPASSVLTLDARVEGLAAGTRLLVDDAGGATTAVTVARVDTGPAALGSLTDTVTLLTVSPDVPASADRRQVTIYELPGDPIPLWGCAYPSRISTGTVLVSGRRPSDDTIEVGRTIAGETYRPGVTVAAADLPTGRTVLLGDAQSDPVDATVESVSIVGATLFAEATADDPATVRELGLDAGASAAITGALGAPVDALALSSPAPRLIVRIGSAPARSVSLPTGIESLSAAAAALQAALNAAAPSPEFAQARVHVIDRRLAVFAGVPGLDVEFLGEATDPRTARELGLDHDLVQPARGLVSAPLPDHPILSAAAHALAVTIGPIGPRTIALTPTAGLVALATELQVRVAQADPSPGFAGIVVLASGSRLILLPGPVGSEPVEYLRIDLALKQPLDLDTATAYILGNVAAVSHGESVRAEVVGSGDAAAAFPRYSLKKKPLTYLPSAAPGGLQSSLTVAVDGVLWDEAHGLYGEPADARVYTTRTEDDGTTTLQFGDGANGATPSTGAGNIAATYRVGAGVAGRVRAAALTSALDRPPGLKSVTNPLPAHGGADPERIEDARSGAPATVRTFGRAVSLEDFSDLVRDTRLVGKAQATWVWDGYDRAIHLTVAGQEGGTFTDEDLRTLAASLAEASQPGHRLRLANYVPLPIVLRGRLTVDRHRLRADVLAAVRSAVLTGLGFDAVALGQAVHLSDMYRVIQGVAGVVSADLTEFQPKRPADRDRPNVDRMPDGTPAPLQPHIRVFGGRPDPLHPGAVLPAELAEVEDPAADVTLAAEGGADA
jgi:hypothetical protein